MVRKPLEELSLDFDDVFRFEQATEEYRKMAREAQEQRCNLSDTQYSLALFGHELRVVSRTGCIGCYMDAGNSFFSAIARHDFSSIIRFDGKKVFLLDQTQADGKAPYLKGVMQKALTDILQRRTSDGMIKLVNPRGVYGCAQRLVHLMMRLYELYGAERVTYVPEAIIFSEF